MKERAGRVFAAKSPSWPNAGCAGSVILRILVRVEGAEGGFVVDRERPMMVSAGRDLLRWGRVRYVISGGQLEGVLEGFKEETVVEVFAGGFGVRGEPFVGMVLCIGLWWWWWVCLSVVSHGERCRKYGWVAVGKSGILRVYLFNARSGTWYHIILYR